LNGILTTQIHQGLVEKFLSVEVRQQNSLMTNDQIDKFCEDFGSTKGNFQLLMGDDRELEEFGRIFHVSKRNI
jgi:hypothetical protein